MNVLLVISLASLIIFIGFLGDLAFKKLRFPDILVLLLIGYLIVFFLKTNEYLVLNEYMPLAATISLIIILFEGGLTLNISSTRKILKDSILMAISYYSVSFLLIYISLYLLKINDLSEFLYASILSSPSVAIVISLVNRSNMDDEKRHKYILYATILDLISIIVTISILQYYPITFNNLIKVVASIISVIIIQSFIGGLAGILWTEILRKIGNIDLSYMLTLAYVLAIYSISSLLWSNGMITVIVIGLILANSNKIRNILGINNFDVDDNIMRFNREVSFFFRTIIFVSIGSMLYIARINFHLLLIILIILVIIYVVQILTTKFVENSILNRHFHYLMPRGLTQITMAILAYSSGYKNYDIIYVVTFVIIITNIITPLFIYFSKIKNILKNK
ncbi:MAG: cation:proton antiporter [Thermoplasmata archaeon]